MKSKYSILKKENIMINMSFNPTEEEIRIVSKALDDYNFAIVEN